MRSAVVGVYLSLDQYKHQKSRGEKTWERQNSHPFGAKH
jgi:hypothetical protein